MQASVCSKSMPAIVSIIVVVVSRECLALVVAWLRSVTMFTIELESIRATLY
jgi:hypothetical protein